ncbi:MAG TPA: hypothetical protein VFA44_05595 [Gaiellaceae bacterium]|nr:hypothetical protein [Gaiellaceae bacterium]
MAAADLPAAGDRHVLRRRPGDSEPPVEVGDVGVDEAVEGDDGDRLPAAVRARAAERRHIVGGGGVVRRKRAGPE